MNPEDLIIIESVDDGKQKLEDIKKKWEKIKSNDTHKFPEFTDDRIAKLEDLLNIGFQDFAMVIRVINEFNLLNGIFITPRLDLEKIFLHTPVNEKIIYFIKYQELFSDKEYWERLSMIYTMQDFQKIPYNIYNSLFKSDRSFKDHLMDDDEKKVFQNLPDKFKVYRCMCNKELESKEFGFSWTLSKDVAQFFVERNKEIFEKKHIIHDKIINKSEAIAYLNGRNEEEILYLPQ